MQPQKRPIPIWNGLFAISGLAKLSVVYHTDNIKKRDYAWRFRYDFAQNDPAAGSARMCFLRERAL